MTECKRCRKKGIFLKLNPEGICQDCEFHQILKEGPIVKPAEKNLNNNSVNMRLELTTPQTTELQICGANYTNSLTLTSNSLKIIKGKDERIIPIIQIISFQIREPSLMRPGLITIVLGGTPDSAIKLTNSITVVNGNNILFSFPEDCLDKVKKIASYVADYGLSSSTSSQQVSDADELSKWKALLDNGAITQEEYDLKKGQILKI